jgi:hypothetical protein
LKNKSKNKIKLKNKRVILFYYLSNQTTTGSDANTDVDFGLILRNSRFNSSLYFNSNPDNQNALLNNANNFSSSTVTSDDKNDKKKDGEDFISIADSFWN